MRFTDCKLSLSKGHCQSDLDNYNFLAFLN